MKKLNKLVKIILPNFDFEENANLFINKKSQSLFNECIENIYTIYSTDTWMNMFPAAKYAKYCNIQDLYLNIKLNADAKIQILDLKYNTAYPHSSTIVTTIDLKANEPVQCEVPHFEVYENLYLKIFTAADHLEFKECYWGTTTQAAYENKIAIITCTYKREQFIQKNIALFNEFMTSNPELANRLKMFVIDNGRTLDKGLENEHVKIIPNINAGGAGGFTRGIIEVKNLDEKYSRVLLMDDDVLVFTESFYRTLIFSDYLKNEFKNSFIHGAMLELYRKNFFHESNAIQSDTFVSSLYGKNDISLPENIAKTNYTLEHIYENKNRKISSAWWYCCFSLEFIQQKGLPMPMFFRFDDIEWSWRNFGEHHIAMNGICIWHVPFKWRDSKVARYYFAVRNSYFANMLHTDKFKKILLKDVKQKYKYLLERYDYTSCTVLLQAMKDLLNGDASFRENPEDLIKRVNALTSNDKYGTVSDFAKVGKILKDFALLTSNPQSIKHKTFFLKLLYKLTYRGKFLPAAFWKKSRNCPSEAPHKEYFYLTKQVNVYNLLTNKYEIRKKDKQKEKMLTKEFKKLYPSLDKNYLLLKNKFISAHEEFKTEEFWKQYLKIDK